MNICHANLYSSKQKALKTVLFFSTDKNQVVSVEVPAHMKIVKRINKCPNINNFVSGEDTKQDLHEVKIKDEHDKEVSVMMPIRMKVIQSILELSKIWL